MKTKRINPADYTEHKNYEQMVAWRVAELLGLEVTIPKFGLEYMEKLVNDKPVVLHKGDYFRPHSPDIVLRLMEWLTKEKGIAICIIPHRGFYLLADGKTRDKLSQGESIEQAIINCTMSISGEFNCPTDVIGEG